jgi:polysaccharide export outer membrane protein
MKKIALYHPLAVLFAASLALAQAPPQAVPQTAPIDATYRVGPRDLIQISVDEDKTLDGEHRITETGFINIRLLGDVQVAGKTVLEIAAQLKRLLEERLMQRASVDVQVKEFRSRPISIIGAVKQPGNLGFSGRWTLLEALTAVGGLADEHGSVVYILRRAENGLSDQVAIDLDELMARGLREVNIPLFANDLINVPGTIEINVYCLGEVARPGALAFKGNERITLLAAIAHAGGLTDRASRRILIKRSSRSGAPDQEIVVDYKQILAGKAPDVDLKQGDVIVVKESFF